MTINFSCSGGRVIYKAGNVHPGFTSYAFTASGGSVKPFASSPTMLVNPTPFSCSGLRCNPTSDSPSMTLGLLPKGLQFVDNGNGTAFVHGTPAKGTAGVYLIPIKVTAEGTELTRVFRLVISEKGQ